MDKLSLKNKDWKDFYLSDFFDFEKGNQNNMASLTTGTLPLVSAKKTMVIKASYQRNKRKSFEVIF